MRYRCLDDFPRGISVFAIFSNGIAVLGTPPPPNVPLFETDNLVRVSWFLFMPAPKLNGSLATNVLFVQLEDAEGVL